MMRLRAADWFSTEICRLPMIDSKRDCEAPITARWELILSIARSMLSITIRMSMAATLPAIEARLVLVPSALPATAKMSLSSVRFGVVMVMVSLSVVLAPTWKL